MKQPEKKGGERKEREITGRLPGGKKNGVPLDSLTPF